MYGDGGRGDQKKAIEQQYKYDQEMWSFNWNTGDTTEDLTNLGAGIYILTSNDINGCQITETVNISEPGTIPPPRTLLSSESFVMILCSCV